MKVINETKNVEIPPYEYLLSHIDTFDKIGGYDSDIYRVEGERETIIDIVVYALIYDKLAYLRTASICPEDLIESRTSWDELKDYTNNLESFAYSVLSVAKKMAEKEHEIDLFGED